MKPENIPLKEQLDQLVGGLAELEKVARLLANDPVHSQSPHIAPVRSRLLVSIEGMGWHAKALAELPDPAPTAAATPAAKPVNPKPKAATDATAGATAPR